MSVDRVEALATARKLLRTFDSAPEPRRQARSIYGELSRSDGWSERQHDEIEAFGAWLLGRPPILELRPRCEQLLAKLRRA